MRYLEIIEEANALPGEIAICLESLEGEERASLNEDTPMLAASVIKLGVLLEAFRRFEEEPFFKDILYVLRRGDKVPSCGALTYMHDGVMITHLDLATLMIILSDNTATNILIDILGIPSINRTLEACGLPGMALRRRMFDAQAASQGLENTVTAKAVANFFRKLYEGKLISSCASREMLAIFQNQRLNGKMPFYLHAMGVKTAHKTGEDDGISHDAGIIYTDQPQIAVFLSNHTDAPRFERFIQDACRKLA